MTKHLLLIEDNEEVRRQLQWGFFEEPYTVLTAGSVEEALKLQRKFKPQVITLDLGLPPDPEGYSEGMRCLTELLAQDPQARVIVITGHHDIHNALRCINSGACDFCRKPLNLEELLVIVRRAFFLSELRSTPVSLTGDETEEPAHGIIGRSKIIQEVMHDIARVAASDAPVLIMGESGTGKELIARAIHTMSRRSGKDMVTINCGAIPENLLETEFFGHEKGAFTGAAQRVQGKVEYADGGTLFLDEIGELPPQLQVKLLRFLQEMVIQRVGGRQDIAVNVRIIAATNRDITACIKTGTFREDLYYRVGVVTITLPPLRVRENDALLLARHFFDKFNAGGKVTGFHPLAEQAICAHAWPGNVRELENRVRRALIFAAGTLITPEELGLEEKSGQPWAVTQSDEPLSLREARNSVERQMVLAALTRHSGNIVQAAQSLGISRPTFYDLLKKHRLDG